MANTNITNIDSLRYGISACTRLLNMEGILDYSGHVSARLPNNEGFLIQSRHASRATLAPEDIYALDFDGEVIDGPQDTRPVSEFYIHSEIYKLRPDVNAILHAHPDVPILFTIAKGAELLMVKNHGYRWRSGVPTHPDIGHINSSELGKALATTLGEHNAALVRAHGVVLVSESIPALLIDAIHFDDNARALLELSRLGPPLPLTDKEIDMFMDRFNRGHHAEKLWHYYTKRAFDSGTLPDDWQTKV